MEIDSAFLWEMHTTAADASQSRQIALPGDGRRWQSANTNCGHVATWQSEATGGDDDVMAQNRRSSADAAAYDARVDGRVDRVRADDAAELGDEDAAFRADDDGPALRTHVRHARLAELPRAA